jgi:hypothetical protein
MEILILISVFRSESGNIFVSTKLLIMKQIYLMHNPAACQDMLSNDYDCYSVRNSWLACKHSRCAIKILFRTYSFTDTKHMQSSTLKTSQKI